MNYSSNFKQIISEFIRIDMVVVFKQYPGSDYADIPYLRFLYTF